MGTVCEFLRFCAIHELVDVGLVAKLYETRELRALRPATRPARTASSAWCDPACLRFVVPETPFEFIEPDRVDELVAAATNARDRFLVVLAATTGACIGEALGLHRQDMHLLADSHVLGCSVAGPHLHVRRRADNANGALAKSRFPRSIPVPEEAVTLYADYSHERHLRLGDEENPLVFVNCYRRPLGAAMSYQNAKEMFDRLAHASGIAVRPHLLRHTAATTWLRQGTPRDTVQELLGHVSPTSMQPYLHPNEQDKREAIERGAAWARRR